MPDGWEPSYFILPASKEKAPEIQELSFSEGGVDWN